MQESLQTFGRGQAVENGFFLLGIEGWLAADGFQLFLPPALLRLVADVHVLGTHAGAIGFAQCVEQVTQ
ncbi:hypothetical protein FQZ97_1017060 [compost metagenome]